MLAPTEYKLPASAVPCIPVLSIFFTWPIQEPLSVRIYLALIYDHMSLDQHMYRPWNLDLDPVIANRLKESFIMQNTGKPRGSPYLQLYK